MEPKSHKGLEVDWRILAILLIDNPMSALVSRTQTVVNYDGDSIAVRGLFGHERTEIDLEFALVDAPIVVSRAIGQVIKVGQTFMRQDLLVKSISGQPKQRAVLMMAEMLRQNLAVSLELAKRQLEAALLAESVDPVSYMPTEFA